MGYPETAESTIDTLRMSTNALRALVGSRLRELAASGGRGRRCGAPFPLGTRVTIRVHEPSGWAQTHAAVAVDLTTSTIGLLWGRYAHAGTTCRVDLTALTGERVSLTGRIIGCLHVDGTVHEIGVRFDQRIDPGKFIAGASVRVDRPEKPIANAAQLRRDADISEGKGEGTQPVSAAEGSVVPSGKNTVEDPNPPEGALEPEMGSGRMTLSEPASVTGPSEVARANAALRATEIAFAALSGEDLAGVAQRVHELAQSLAAWLPSAGVADGNHDSPSVLMKTEPFDQ